MVPGQPLTLNDSRGEFLAYGYGHPASLIAFRELSRDPADVNAFSIESLAHRIFRAFEKRRRLGLTHRSFRLCHGEADQVSGATIDVYSLRNSPWARAIVVQIQSAAMERALFEQPNVWNLVAGKCFPGEAVVTIFRRSSSSRERDGLRIEETTSVPQGATLLREAEVVVGRGESEAALRTNLWDGQKTGLFLDQIDNIFLVAGILRNSQPKVVRVLDLCCYVGQWSALLTRALPSVKIKTTLVDASKTALHYALQNARDSGADAEAIELDVLGERWIEEKFDVVICDPPALIKHRKALATGFKGYVKLNRRAMQATEKNGFLVSCSCSSILTEEDFEDALSIAQSREGRSFSTIARGGQSLDHPHRLGFPEGQYLKTLIFQKE